MENDREREKKKGGGEISSKDVIRLCQLKESLWAKLMDFFSGCRSPVFLPSF